MCVATGTGLNYWMCYCMRGFSMRWMFSCAVQYINLVLGMQPHISQLIMGIQDCTFVLMFTAVLKTSTASLSYAIQFSRDKLYAFL